MNPKYFLIVITLCLILTAYLRIDTINENGFWGDEGWSVEFSEPHNPADVTRNMVDDLHPPLYFIVLSYWRQLAGDTEIPLRLLATFSALLTGALLYRIAKDWLNSITGIFAVLILALSDKHILLSQEVRHYPTAFMLMAWSSLIFLRWCQRPTRTYTLLYSISLVIAVYTHYYAGLIAIVQLSYAIAFLKPRPRLIRLLSIMGLSLVAFIPWTFIAYHQLDIRPEGILHSMPLNWQTAKTLSIDYLGRPPVFLAVLTMLGIFSPNPTPFRLKIAPPIAYIALWAFLPLALTIVLYDYVTLLTDRNLALILLPIALLAGRGMSRFPLSSRTILATIFVANSLASLDSQYVNPPFRELARYVADNHPQGEPVFMDVRGGDKAMGYHLRQMLPPDTLIVSFEQARIKYGVYFLSALKTLLDSTDGFWIAYWGNQPYELDSIFHDQGFVRTAIHQEFHLDAPIDLYHYDRLPPPDQSIATFGDSITLRLVRYETSISHREAFSVRLWWNTNTNLATSYSISVFFLNADGSLLLDSDGQLIVQHDGPPQNGQSPTNTWQIGETILDSHILSIPPTLPAGDYLLCIKIYNSDNGEVVFVTTSNNPQPSEYLPLGVISVR